MKRKVLNTDKLDMKGFFIIACSFLIYFCWSLRLPVSMAPDEYMRYDIPLWIYQNNALPRGDNEELINEIWGYSYGFTPYLSSLFSVVFMKIAAFFSDADEVLRIAARASSVLAGTGTVFFCLKIGALCFKEIRYRYIYAIMVAFLPQFVFLSSYLNCDCIAVFSVTLILYYWIRGIQEHWSVRICIGLGVAIGICALSYYFAYAYILCSIIVFFLSIYIDKENNQKKRSVFLRANIIFWVAFAVAGWFFIRNFILYNGDFLGMRATSECAEIYAQLEYKPSHHWTWRRDSLSIIDMLLKSNWIVGTVISFLAVFGYKNIVVNYVYYIIYFFILLLGFLLYIKYYLRCGKRSKILFFGSILSCIITVFISIYSSWSRDYQSQGRYIMEILPVVMLLCVYGYREADRVLEKRGMTGKLSFIISIAWILLFLCIFVFYCIPVCMGGLMK